MVRAVWENAVLAEGDGGRSQHENVGFLSPLVWTAWATAPPAARRSFFLPDVEQSPSVTQEC
jgi:hypothetical protein